MGGSSAMTVRLSTTASARVTPGCWRIASWVSAASTRVVVNGPLAPWATTQWSAPNAATIAGPSLSAVRRMPSTANAMLNTSDVTSTAITKRRDRNCKSLMLTSHTSAVPLAPCPSEVGHPPV